MNIFVTGGSGFIGSHFVEPLYQRFHTIVNFDLRPPSGAAEDNPFVQGDVRDEHAVLSAMSGCDAVLHLAAAHHDFGISHSTFEAVNVDGARNLCRAMDTHGIQDICFFSSVAVYGDAPAPAEEGTTPQPNSPYGQTKLAAEHVFQEWVQAKPGRRCLVIRPTITFGPGNFANMFTLISQIDRKQFLQVGAGKNVKSLSYVENLVAATVDQWLENPEQRKNFDAFNYVDKPDLKSAEITAAIYEALGRRPPRWKVPYILARLIALPIDLVIALTGKNLPISGARIHKLAAAQTQFASQKIRDAGFSQPTALTKGIQNMVEWYLAEGRSVAASGISPSVPPSQPVLTEAPAKTPETVTQSTN